MKKLLLVDDHDVLRDGVKAIVSGQPGTVVFGDAGSASEALRLAAQAHWDAVVLDLSLGGRDGLEVLKQLRLMCPKLPVLILSMHSEVQYARRAFKAGAAGYITKDSPRAEIARAIQKILEGGRYVSASMAENMVLDLERGNTGPPHESLSDREYEVMCFIASGKTVGEIANLLSLSVNTISTYRARILEKMAMETNAQLTHYAIVNKLVQ